MVLDLFSEYVAFMSADDQRERGSEVEIYGELGLTPKLGMKIRFSQTRRVQQMISAAAASSAVDAEGLEANLSAADDRVRDVFRIAVERARDV